MRGGGGGLVVAGLFVLVGSCNGCCCALGSVKELGGDVQAGNSM